jgi:hypothetical protein
VRRGLTGFEAGVCRVLELVVVFVAMDGCVWIFSLVDAVTFGRVPAEDDFGMFAAGFRVLD